MASSPDAPAVSPDALLERIGRGGRVSPSELAEMAASSDILSLGMLADAVRHRRDAPTTFLRVAHVQDVSGLLEIPAQARELRLISTPPTLVAAVAAVSALRSVAGGRTVSACSWGDIERFAADAGSVTTALSALRQAGLDRLIEVPVDGNASPQAAIDALAAAGYRRICLTVERAASAEAMLEAFLRAAASVERVGGEAVAAIAPLPTRPDPLRPTTGYDDVKAVSLARLAMPEGARVQVDWLRYGPKLAQVALTFGADDLDNVTASDESPDGRRRGPLEELRRNVEAAGFTAVERDGWYEVVNV